MLLNYQTLRTKQDQIVKEVDQKKITDAEQREAARQFVNKWRGKGNEKAEYGSETLKRLSGDLTE